MNVLRFLLGLVLSCLVIGGMSVASQTTLPKGKLQPPEPIVKGVDLFKFYCAVCHGVDAKGDGPLAPQLKTMPANLTVLARNNKGQLPGVRVRKMIAGVMNPGHRMGLSNAPRMGAYFSWDRIGPSPRRCEASQSGGIPWSQSSRSRKWSCWIHKGETRDPIMLVNEMTGKECREFLARSSFGRLACTRESEPYIVPIYFVYESDHLYGFSTFGQKIRWMRSNPRVCVEIDEVPNHFRWKSVIVSGRYKELPDEPSIAQNAIRLGCCWRNASSGGRPPTRLCSCALRVSAIHLCSTAFTLRV